MRSESVPQFCPGSSGLAETADSLESVAVVVVRCLGFSYPYPYVCDVIDVIRGKLLKHQLFKDKKMKSIH